MSAEIKIEKSLARMIRYCLEYAYVVLVLLAIVLFIVLAIFKAWIAMLYVIVFPLIGFFIIFLIIYWIVKVKDKVYYIFATDTIKKMKCDTEICTVPLDDIERIEFFSVIPFLDVTILPSPTLVIDLKNQKDIRIFCKKRKIEDLKKVFKKEIVMHK